MARTKEHLQTEFAHPETSNDVLGAVADWYCNYKRTKMLSKDYEQLGVLKKTGRTGTAAGSGKGMQQQAPSTYFTWTTL